jgi:hypothetical protein
MKGLLNRFGVTPSSAFGRSAQVQVVDMRKSDIRVCKAITVTNAVSPENHPATKGRPPTSRILWDVGSLNCMKSMKMNARQSSSAAAKLVSLSDSPVFLLGPLEWTTNNSAELCTRPI